MGTRCAQAAIAGATVFRKEESMSISAILGLISSHTSADTSSQDGAKLATPTETDKLQKKAPPEPPSPPADKIELSERSKVAQLEKQGQDPSQIAAHLGLSIPMVQSDLFPTDTTSLTALPAIDFDA